MNVAMMVRNSTSPIISPVLRPIAKNSTKNTMVTALAKLKIKSFVARVTASGWKLISPISIPIGWLPFQFLEFLSNASAHSYDVAALHCGDTQADGWLAVIPEHTARWVFVAAFQRRRRPCRVS